MEKAQGRRKERPAARERQAEQAVEKKVEVMPEDARLRQAQLRAARQERAAPAAGALATPQVVQNPQAHQQAARLGKLALQDETQPPRQP